MSKNNQELLSVAPKNQNEFGAMVNQLAFGMQDKVHLFTAQKDTIELADLYLSTNVWNEPRHHHDVCVSKRGRQTKPRLPQLHH